MAVPTTKGPRDGTPVEGKTMAQPTIDKFSRPLQGPIRVPVTEDPEWEKLLKESQEEEMRLEKKEKERGQK